MSSRVCCIVLVKMVKKGSENGRVFGGGIAPGRVLTILAEMRNPLVKPAREHFASDEFRIAQNIAKEGGVGFDACHGVFSKCALQPRDGLAAVRPPAKSFPHR